MIKKIKASFTLLVILLTSCVSDDIESFQEENQEHKIINHIQYKVVNIDPNQNICDQISNLTNNSYLEFVSGQTEMISCDILIENKSNIIINGNNSYLKYNDPTRIGFKIKIVNSQNISIESLNIDNNNTKPSYELDPTNRSISGRIEVIESNKIELNSINLNRQQVFGSPHGTVTQVLFKETTNSQIKDCKMEYADGELIFLLASKNCLISNNFLNEGTSGIATAGYNKSGINKIGYDNRIVNNTVVNSSTAFITINDRNALVEGNYIYNNDSSKVHGPGIRFGHKQDFLHASNAICKNNVIQNLKFPNGNYNPVGIKVDYTQTSESNQTFTDLIIEGNEIINCQGGIKVSNQSGQYILIKDNQISSTTRFSIDLFSADPNGQQTKPQYCLISNNTLSSENGVVRIHNSTTTLSDNHISSKSNDINNATIFIGNVYDSGNFPNEIKLKNNILELNGNNGIYYNGNNLRNALVLDNIISNGNLGIYLGGKENLIKRNVIRNCSSRSIYIKSGSINTTISNNDVYNDFENSVYLHNTIGTSVLNNKFNFTGTTEYPWAVWKNSPSTNLNCIIQDNILNNFTNESN